MASDVRASMVASDLLADGQLAPCPAPAEANLQMMMMMMMFGILCFAVFCLSLGLCFAPSPSADFFLGPICV